MRKKYDLVIVGAGPGGAMAAKTAGENGLSTAILDRKTNPAEIKRGCAMMFAIESDYYFAERMYFNEKNRKMIFPVNGFSVDYEGNTRNFYAWHFYAPDGKTRLEFGNYEESIKKGDRGRLSFVYDKGKLIEGLMRDAVNNGVDVFTGINVNGIEKTKGGLQVTRMTATGMLSRGPIAMASASCPPRSDPGILHHRPARRASRPEEWILQRSQAGTRHHDIRGAGPRGGQSTCQPAGRPAARAAGARRHRNRRVS